eukprot:4456772-Lingulodinium_polyedra.AAC.1
MDRVVLRQGGGATGLAQANNEHLHVRVRTEAAGRAGYLHDAQATPCVSWQDCFFNAVRRVGRRRRDVAERRSPQRAD